MQNGDWDRVEGTPRGVGGVHDGLNSGSGSALPDASFTPQGLPPRQPRCRFHSGAAGGSTSTAGPGFRHR